MEQCRMSMKAVWLCALLWAGSSVTAETVTGGAVGRNSVSVMPGAPKVKYSKMIFGQFIEHFDNQVYGGLYDPESKFADEDGFRKDVIEALREIKTPIVRWPGGCFVSTYHWLDGVGERTYPGVRQDLAGRRSEHFRDG